MLLFLLVKIFFTPLMINFFFNNYFSVKEQIGALGGVDTLFSVHGFNAFLYPFLLSLIFLADTLYFSFGYMLEAKFLKNNIRSVEPTILGWAVALVCYPPFNEFYGRHINWYANDMVSFGTDTATFIIRGFITLFLLIYLGATLALGTKCSNLTNRGIVTKGPYAVIRHPAYMCKNLAWWITIIPVMSVGAFISMLSWTVIYYLRAITEEKHLMKDPEYQSYCRKVKYRFLPYIW
jgi:protein-S-isoprenylcysteine O-methyltransferase Ste14